MPGIFDWPGSPLRIFVGNTFDTKDAISSELHINTSLITGYDHGNRRHQLSVEVTYRIIVPNNASNLEPLNPVRLIGTNQYDTLRGTNNSDTMRGLEGDDKIHAFNGNDTIYGDLESDYVYGGDGNDKVYGAAGNDILYGEMGNDDLLGEEGDNKLHGHVGNDIIIGGIGQDELFGEDWDDTIRSLDGNSDSIECGTGVDTVDGYDIIRDPIPQDCEIRNNGNVSI